MLKKEKNKRKMNYGRHPLGLVNIFMSVLPWYAAGGGGADSFFLAMDNGEFNNRGGGAAADSGYSGCGSKGGGAFDGGGIV